MPFLVRIILSSIFISLASVHVYAGVCDLSGSGIGGTGTPVLNNSGSGIGGTGAPASKSNGSGMGGTGAIANGSGIGGTGQKTDSQAAMIIGTITGFGSICVNGIEIHYADSTPVQINGEPANTEQLALGQVVSVTVSGAGNEVIAQDIQVMNVVSGPIAEIDPKLNRVTVLGQHVQLLEKTHFSANHAGITNFHIGDFIQVSGLRQDDGDIVASRIDRTLFENSVHISGTTKNVTADGFMIGDMRIDSHGLPTVSEGQEVLVAGQLVAEKIIAEQLTVPANIVSQRLRIEGFVSIDTDNTEKPQIKIGHVVIDATEQIKIRLLTLSLEQSVIIDGAVKDEHIIIVDQLFIKDHIDKPDIENLRQEIHESNRDSKTQSQDELEIEKNELHKEETEEQNHLENKEIEKDDDEAKLPDTRAVDVETIESEDADLEKPEIESDEIELPEKESSEVESPKVEVPEVEDPEVETSEVEIPENETSEVEAPEVEVPEVEVPEVEETEIEIPEIE